MHAGPAGPLTAGDYDLSVAYTLALGDGAGDLNVNYHWSIWAILAALAVGACRVRQRRDRRHLRDRSIHRHLRNGHVHRRRRALDQCVADAQRHLDRLVDQVIASSASRSVLLAWGSASSSGTSSSTPGRAASSSSAAGTASPAAASGSTASAEERWSSGISAPAPACYARTTGAQTRRRASASCCPRMQRRSGRHDVDAGAVQPLGRLHHQRFRRRASWASSCWASGCTSSSCSAAARS